MRCPLDSGVVECTNEGSILDRKWGGGGGGGFGRRRGGKGGFGRGVCPVYRGALCPNHSSEVPTVIRPQVHTTMHSM